VQYREKILINTQNINVFIAKNKDYVDERLKERYALQKEYKAFKYSLE
jgi:hypothetical protein